MKKILRNSQFRNVIYVAAILFMTMGLSAQKSHDVAVTNNEFSPADLTISVGDTVVWTNSAGFHNVNGTQATHTTNPESFGNDTGTDWVYSFVFNTPGDYNYQCNPHVGLGMVGTIKVLEKPSITINFSGMTPHVGQDLWLAVIDVASGTEIVRMKKVVEETFTIVATDLELEKEYNIDFYADHNENGSYDAPNSDHAWRLNIENLEGDSTLEFEHNTMFTDIEWKHKLTVEFTGMTPHIDQLFEWYLYDITAEVYVDTVVLNPIAMADFNIVSFMIQQGESYNIDFFADLSGNGTYDAPGTDHAWRIVLSDLVGDTTISFTHNTDFTDIFEGQSSVEESTSFRGGDLNIYPNPSKDFLTISHKDFRNTLVELKVIDLNGREVLNKEIINSDKNLTLDISQLKSGIYYLEIKANTISETMKFIKME